MSNSPPWSPPPSFNNASRGYWGYEVDRLIDDLKSADLAGEPLGPIIADRELSEVGFGYDTSEVDAYLATLSGLQVIVETNTPEGVVLKRAADQEAERPQPGNPAPAPAEPEYQVLEPYVQGAAEREDGEWTQSWSGESGAMLAEIYGAAMLPAPGKEETGYDAREVDQFFSQLAGMIRANQPVTGPLQNCRLKIARRGTPSYDVEAVDSLMDRLEVLSSSTDAAPQGTYSVSRTVRTTKPRGLNIMGKPTCQSVFIIVVCVFVFGVTGIIVFFNLLVPLLMR